LVDPYNSSYSKIKHRDDVISSSIEVMNLHHPVLWWWWWWWCGW